MYDSFSGWSAFSAGSPNLNVRICVDYSIKIEMKGDRDGKNQRQ